MGGYYPPDECRCLVVPFVPSVASNLSTDVGRSHGLISGWRKSCRVAVVTLRPFAAGWSAVGAAWQTSPPI